MKSLLTALQEGRLVELPTNDKGKALEFLANLIEAVPDLPGVPALYEGMMARERTTSTALGMGVACPHVRAAGGSGELICAVGWSPEGIEFDAPDGKKVHLVVMYYIPDAQKHVYLKELSGLAAAMQREGGIQPIATADDVATVRERLLDWVSAAIEANVPEAKARMIRLEARQAATEIAPVAAPAAGDLKIESVLFVEQANQPPLVLCNQVELAMALERLEGLRDLLQQRAQFECDGWRVVSRELTRYEGGRALHTCTAVKATPVPIAQK
jgi:mannitol/fructose-specific phosphotransferase system IIA component (Ntr-type)